MIIHFPFIISTQVSPTLGVAVMRTVSIPSEFLEQISGAYVDQFELRKENGENLYYRRSTFIDGNCAERLLEGHELMVLVQSSASSCVGNLRTNALVYLMDGTEIRYELANDIVWAPDDRPGRKALGRLVGFQEIITAIMDSVAWKPVNQEVEIASLPHLESPDSPATTKEAPG
jgi:hypothetical protein